MSLGCGCSPNRPTATQPTIATPLPVRVLTWNLHRCEAGVAAIEREIVKQKPDLLCLQEAEVADDPAGTRNLLPRLAAALSGHSIVSGHTLGLPESQHCDVVILSRWPMRSVQAHSLEPGGWVYAIEACLESGPHQLTVLSVHTHATWRLMDAEHVRESTAVRTRQIEAIIELAGSRGRSVLIAGDFNAPMGTAEQQLLAKHLNDLAPAGPERWATVPATMPLLRLDYIFSNGDIRRRTYQVLDARYSDHRPVQAEVVWQPINMP